ncbi:MAG: aldo/keto reductase [Anaeroplasmataceae bacterium]
MKTIKLNSGYNIPTMGLGVFLIKDLEECEKVVSFAIEYGYRHIDTANAYLNEKAVGIAVNNSNVNREDLYITSKIWPSSFDKDNCVKAVEDTFKRLDLEYVDLMLLHQPYGDYLNAWKVLEDYVAKGKIRSIGLSNFSIEKTKQILEIAKIKPAVNQIECHPFNQQKEMDTFLKQHDIKIESWYPVGHGDSKLIEHETITKLAKKYNKSNVQILLRWQVDTNKITFPKSTNFDHIKANYDIYDFKLTEDDLKEIDLMDTKTPYYFVDNEDTKGFSKMVLDFSSQE